MGEKLDLQAFLNKILHRIFGLTAIVISDREGFPITQVSKSKEEYETLAATFATVADQAGKFKMGKNLSITTFYADHIIIHINQLPLVITLIGEPNMNVGFVNSTFMAELEAAFLPLKDSIITIEKESESQ
eukprot:TRINITY_DN8276_c0_g1_i2.p1 TRINITY_DN8276_c0_g1~~TRINITY_DN8276_c0_g1_i2.p1  ORF type:complete len:131 (+),score=42.97 TRINITY_DN8276_c0_g1_i2:49-441(+)